MGIDQSAHRGGEGTASAHGMNENVMPNHQGGDAVGAVLALLPGDRLLLQLGQMARDPHRSDLQPLPQPGVA